MTVRRATALLLAPAAIVVSAGCGSEDAGSRAAPDRATGTAGAAVSSATGPGLSIEEARTSPLPGPLLVRGALLVDDSGARLCEDLAESDPPQCAGDHLQVVGLDTETLPDELSEAAGVRWGEQVKLLGRIEDGRLVVSVTESG